MRNLSDGGEGFFPEDMLADSPKPLLNMNNSSIRHKYKLINSLSGNNILRLQYYYHMEQSCNYLSTLTWLGNFIVENLQRVKWACLRQISLIWNISLPLRYYLVT